MLKMLSVQHYKSLSEVKIEFHPITILVGPNGSGKSNVIDALRFLRDAVVHGLDHAVSDRGGIDILRQYSPTRPYMIRLRAEFSDTQSDGSGLDAAYEVRISSARGEYKIHHEYARWESIETETDEFGEIGESFLVESEFVRHDDGRMEINDEPLEFYVPQDSLAVTHLFQLRPVARQFSQMRFANIYPNILREPSRPDTDRHLKENCANWASVIKSMRNRKVGERYLHKITELMRQALPGLQNVTVKGVGGYLVPQFKLQDSPKGKSHYFDPIQLSDGTLRLFGMLLALYQIPPPPVIALEEPEQTLHPGALGILVDAFKEVSQHTQLIVTTHSPYLLDYFIPDEIRVVYMEEGQTYVKGVKQSQIKIVQRGLMRISEIMALDGLQGE